MVADALAAARRVVPRLAARAGEHDRAGTFPVADFADLRQEQLFGLMVPQRLGGRGAGFADYAEVAYELSRGNGATALVFNMHASVTGALGAVDDNLAEAMGLPDEALAARDQLLADAAAGSWYAVAMSERGAGSRLSQLSTVYHRVDGGYQIKGAKAFCSGAGHASGYLVAARHADDQSVVSQFLVPADTPGLRVEQSWDSLGMRATCSHDLHLDVTVGQRTLLGGVEGLALVVAQLMPHWMVASYAAVYAGVARAAVDAAVQHLTERGLTHLPAVRARIGRADAAAAAALLTVREAARRVDAEPGDPATNQWVWRAKLVAGGTAAEVASSMLEAAGTSATRRGHPLERLYRDARCGALHPPTSDVCADWLGVATIGGDPDRDGSAPRW
ncbi:acyl-CoA dehydrogenase family protein [Solwaraspora sp. WMMD792]|uniref:acyl-CoA dehydrogenase family protein n=1 Tax=Solwaraspora sp. WMMD792 TaxID=3016099 RepID=UPI0024166721|nr:acyl-CoA dehydrogenase family protein [Solwaraspora sp. WMMD792]MDG4773423.1 acyl-CoA/acyl-ACP dehydrogenase [Solwaraspora sp. WMMD792]